MFDRVLSTLNCDVQQGDVDLTVKPGQTKTFPFTVHRGQPGFHAYVSWASGLLDVSLVRPDTSVLAPGAARAGESITTTPTSADATVTNPPTGHWKVRVHAPRAEARGVRLHLDLWERARPGTETGEDPSGPPKPSGGDGCRYKPSVGSIQAEASCLTIEKNVATMKGRIRVDGLDVAPDGNATLSLNLKTLELKSSGDVTVTAGPLTLFHGTFDRKLAQFSLPVPAAVGRAVNKLKGLPIKGDASIDFKDGVAKVTLNAALPDFGNLTGSVTVSASNASGLQLADASITLPEAKFKGIGIKDASLVYSKAPEGGQVVGPGQGRAAEPDRAGAQRWRHPPQRLVRRRPRRGGRQLPDRRGGVPHPRRRQPPAASRVRVRRWAGDQRRSQGPRGPRDRRRRPLRVHVGRPR